MTTLTDICERPACVVAIDVDGRQRYVFETDKLREMLGASRIIDGTRQLAERHVPPVRGDTPPKAPFLFAPVSGEVRLWAPHAERQALLDKTWEICEFLRERGVEHSAVYLETKAAHFEDTFSAGTPVGAASLKEVYSEIAAALGAVKNAKPWPDARPRCALFAPCRIHGYDPANVWEPCRPVQEDEPRRELVGFRASKKLEAWTNERDEFYKNLLLTPIWTRLDALRQQGLVAVGEDEIDLKRPIMFSDLAEAMESGEKRGDQFMAFVCADGDGLGNVLRHLDWNSAEWGDDGLRPWQRNAEFARGMENLVRRALGEAIAEVVLPGGGEADAKRIRDRSVANLLSKGGARVNLPVLPQLQGGEDLWIVCRREVAIDLARWFADHFKEYANGHADFSGVTAALEVAHKLAAADTSAAGLTAPESEILTISAGIAFAKSGYPVHAMVDSAESLLKTAKALRKGNLPWRNLELAEGCIDWYWIESSLSESVDDSRRRGWVYQDESSLYHLSTRPWSSSETAKFVEAARELQRIPRRKREQLESILRLGSELSELAWQSWRKGLTKCERERLDQKVNASLPEALRLPDVTKSPWLGRHEVSGIRANDIEIKDEFRTPLLDLLALQHVYGWEGSSTRHSEGDAA